MSIISDFIAPYAGALKIAGVVVIGLGIAGGLAYCKYDENKTIAMNVAVVQDKTVISAQQAQIANQVVTTGIQTTVAATTQTAIVGANTEIQQAQAQFATIQQTTAAAVQQIMVAPKPTQQSVPAYQAAQAEAVDNAEYAGLYETYCVSTQQPLTCGDQP
jgi:hypothetical protein